MGAPVDPAPSASRLRAALKRRAGSFAAATLYQFRGEQLAIRAAALTYISIFSLVPLLTVGLLLLSSLHQLEFRDRLDVFITEMLAPGVRRESVQLLQKFLTDAASRAVSWVSVGALLISGGTLLKNLDSSLNELWAVHRKRRWYLRAALYLVAMTLGPVLLALSLVGSSAIRDLLFELGLPNVLLTVTSILAPAAGLTLLYRFAPNAPVRTRPAFLGALVAGLAWSGARFAYAAFALRLFRYNVTYASLGAAPLFLIWLYLSWFIVLFGARLAYAIQHAAYRQTWPIYELHPRGRELLGVRVAQELARAWLEGRTPLTAEQIAAQLMVPPFAVESVVSDLEEARLLTRGDRGYFAARPPDQLTLAETCTAVRLAPSAGRLNPFFRQSPELARVEAMFRQADNLVSSLLRRLTWADLLQLPEGEPLAPGRLEGSRNP